MKTALAKNIAIARKNKGWSQNRVGISVGLRQSTINAYEKGYREPSLQVIKRICVIFHIEQHLLWDFMYNEDFFKNINHET